MRCLKCQGWNHIARECSETQDRCANCAGEHRTNTCPRPQATICISCREDTHASWNRRCPTFIRKIDEFNTRNPENALQFFPTSDAWTWTPSKKPSNDPNLTRQNEENRSSQPPAPPPYPQRLNREPNREKSRGVDTYILNYDRDNGERGKGKMKQRECDTYIPNYVLPSDNGLARILLEGLEAEAG